MNHLAPFVVDRTPGPCRRRWRALRSALLEFFAANIRNQRHAYAQATREFLAWCQSAGVASIDSVQPLHVPTYA